MPIRVCKRCGKRERLKTQFKSEYCRQCYHYVRNKERRVKLQKEKRCLTCGCKVKPKIIYHRRCDDCLPKNQYRNLCRFI